MESGKTGYPWYLTVEDESLCQGDILEDFSVIVPKGTYLEDKIDVELLTIDAIVMTHTCDIK